MKRYILIIILFLSLAILPGCYTVIWTPGEDLPGAEKQEVYVEDNYYAEPYYGDYGYYYQQPWWIVAAPVYSVPVRERKEVERTETTTSDRIRNRDGSRNDRPERIITNPPVTVSRPSGSSGNSTDSSSDNSSTSTRKSTDSDSSSNTSRQSNSSDNGNGSRNSNGGRNNGGRK